MRHMSIQYEIGHNGPLNHRENSKPGANGFGDKDMPANAGVR